MLGLEILNEEALLLIQLEQMSCLEKNPREKGDFNEVFEDEMLQIAINESLQ